MGRIVHTVRARADLAQALAYLEARNPHVARQLSQRFGEVLSLLADRPLIGAPRAGLLPALRSFAVGQYLIFYRPLPDGINVIRILHGARDIEAIFKDDPFN